MRSVSVIVCLLLSAVAISADLQSDIDDVISHLPMKEIESIGKQYVASDPSYADGLRYVEEVTYVQIMADFLQTKEGQNLIEYFNGRGIEIESIWLHMAKITDEIIAKWLEPIKDGEVLEPVITGDIHADYRNVVAASDFLDAVNKKMEASPEFAELVAAYKDPEFGSLFYNASNLKGRAQAHVKTVEGRGLWKKVKKAAVVAAIGSIILG